MKKLLKAFCMSFSMFCAIPTPFSHVWEDSVRSSHDFLTEDDICEIKSQLITSYFPNVEIYGVESGGVLAGFIGLSADKIEMLFVSTAHQGVGIGTALLTFAKDKGYELVDVNEDNPSALKFYEHNGFCISSRDETDDAGRPFPILHLKLK